MSMRVFAAGITNQQWDKRGNLSAQSRVHSVAESGPHEIEDGYAEKDGERGNDHEPPVLIVDASQPQKRSPGRGRRTHAKPQQAETGLGDDGIGNAKGSGDERRR